MHARGVVSPETWTAIGGSGILSFASALIGHAVGWSRSASTTKARVEKIADEAMQGLITNLREDCAEARKDARAAKAEGAEFRAEHERCREDLAEMKRLRAEDRALIDKLMNAKDPSPPYEPKPIPRRRPKS
jgi:hypothetical protein